MEGYLELCAMRGSETRVGVSACAASFRVVPCPCPCDGATRGIMFSILWATCGMNTHAWHMEMHFCYAMRGITFLFYVPRVVRIPTRGTNPNLALTLCKNPCPYPYP